MVLFSISWYQCYMLWSVFEGSLATTEFLQTFLPSCIMCSSKIDTFYAEPLPTCHYSSLNMNLDICSWLKFRSWNGWQDQLGQWILQLGEGRGWLGVLQPNWVSRRSIGFCDVIVAWFLSFNGVPILLFLSIFLASLIRFYVLFPNETG